MRSKQDIFTYLKGPEFYAYERGDYLEKIRAQCKLKRNYRKFYREVDQAFFEMMKLYPVEITSRIIATWLKVYRLPLNATKLKSYDLFHDSHKSYVASGPGIKEYR
jgi:hypothetical protein